MNFWSIWDKRLLWVFDSKHTQKIKDRVLSSASVIATCKYWHVLHLNTCQLGNTYLMYWHVLWYALWNVLVVISWYVLNTYQCVFNTNMYVFNTGQSVLACIVLVLCKYWIIICANTEWIHSTEHAS